MDTIREQKLLARLDALETRCAALETSETAFIEEFDKVWESFSELNLRVLFALQYFQFKKSAPTGLLDGNGQALQETLTTTLYDIYQEQRETFAQKVHAHVQQARADLDANRSHATAAAGATPEAGSDGAKSQLKIVTH